MRKLAFLLFVCCAAQAGAAHAAPRPRIVSIYYYVARDSASPMIFGQNAKRVSIIAPQTFTMDSEGFIMGEVPPEVRYIARKNHVAIMPLVTNRRFDPATMHAVLDDPARQARAIRYLLYYAKRDGAIGFQFDYENILYTYRDKFTEFTEKAARAFHRRGLILTLAVVGRSTGERNPDKPGGWDYWSGVYDYKKLGRVADFLSIMAYPEHTNSPGSIGSIPWMEQIAEYTLGQVPRAKISWGIPVYHLHWYRPAGATETERWQRRGHIFPEVKTLMDQPGAISKYDDELASGSVQYTENGTSHIVWYEDARSMKAKLQFIVRHRFQGFSAWRLGQEDPASWDVLETVRVVRMK